MTFAVLAEKDVTITKEHQSSPGSIGDLVDKPSSSPLAKALMSTMDCGDILRNEVEAEDVKETEDSDDDLNEFVQSFEEHDEICRRLERTLGLQGLGDDDRELDDWSELASLISYHYAAHMDSSWVKSAGKQNISPSALLLCLIYLERMHVTNPDFRYQHLMTSSDLFVVSLMSACKFLYDVGEVGDCYNGTWARHCKIPIKRLNRMEIAFLNGLNWNLQSDLAEFEHVMEKVETDIVRSNLRFHTSMTYADLLVLANLTNGFSCGAVLNNVLSVAKIFAALAASYVLLGAMTLSIGAPIALGFSGHGLPAARSTSAPTAIPTQSQGSCSTPPSSTVVLCNDSTESLGKFIKLSQGQSQGYAEIRNRFSIPRFSREIAVNVPGLTRGGGLGLPAPNIAHLHYSAVF